MNVNISIWKPDITVQVKASMTKNFVSVRIGEGVDGGLVLFMPESDLDQFTDNLLKAKLVYIKEGKK